MRSTHPSQPEWTIGYNGVRTGDFVRASRGFILTQEIEGAVDNYAFRAGGSGQGKGNQFIPRHCHNCAQIRHPLDDLTVETKDPAGGLPAGWIGYFPESVYYGPHHMRAGRKVGIQYGGPYGLGYMTQEQRARGKAACLERGGEFVKGIYSWVDEQGERHNQDGYEAMWEQAMGEPIVYPEPLYDQPVYLNPDDVEWEEIPGFPGALRKTVGVFERDTRVGFISLEPGASFEFGTANSNEVLFLEEGTLVHEGSKHEELSGFSSSADDAPEILTAIDASRIYFVKMPTFRD